MCRLITLEMLTIYILSNKTWKHRKGKVGRDVTKQLWWSYCTLMKTKLLFSIWWNPVVISSLCVCFLFTFWSWDSCWSSLWLSWTEAMPSCTVQMRQAGNQTLNTQNVQSTFRHRLTSIAEVQKKQQKKQKIHQLNSIWGKAGRQEAPPLNQSNNRLIVR